MAGLNNNANPFLSQVRLGTQSIQLIPGLQGPPGTSGIVTTTANFSQPAVSANVSVAVTSTVSMAPGLDVYVVGGGYYSVVSVTDATDVVLENLGSPGNASPGTTVTFGALVGVAGPGGTSLVVSSNGAAITQRATLDLNGLAYVDDPGGNRMRFFVTAGAPLSVTGNVTLTTAQVWVEFTAGPYTITLPASPVTGGLVELTHISGDLSGADQVTLAGNGHTVCDPQDPINVQAASVTLRTTGITYRYRFNGSLWRYVN